jgi:hypothetical protein
MTRILSTILFALVLVALATARVARWCWAHRQQALNATARVALATYSAGEQARAWWEEHQTDVTSAVVLAGLVVLTTGQRVWSWGRSARVALAQHQRLACTLLQRQPVAALAPITANLQALWHGFDLDVA